MRRIQLLIVAAVAACCAVAPATAGAAINCNRYDTWQKRTSCLNLRADNQLQMIVSLRDRIRALESSETVAGLASRVDAVENVNASQASALTTLNSSVSALEAARERHDTRLDAVETANASQQSAITGLASAADTLDAARVRHDERLDAIETYRAKLHACLTLRGVQRYQVNSAYVPGYGWTSGVYAYATPYVNSGDSPLFSMLTTTCDESPF
jgi:hypothetical protein